MDSAGASVSRFHKAILQVSLFLFYFRPYVMLTTRKIILASTSPRRVALLRQLGLNFQVMENGVKETIDPAMAPEENVLRLSYEKAEKVATSINDGLVIGADTIVVLDHHLFGKPKDPNEAVEMLKMLSGREHKVFTGFTIFEKPGEKYFSDVEVTTVKFRALEDDEIREYVRSGTPLDKAGAYGIQDDFGAVFVERIEGCFYNVVGFPLAKFYVSLRKFLSEQL